MKTLMISLASFLFCVSALAEDTGAAMLNNLNEMRIRIENDQARADADARGNTVLRHASGGDSLAEMRGEMRQSLEHISNRFRCLDVDLDVKNSEQTNLMVVCGDVTNTSVATTNTRADRDLTVTTGGAP